MGILFIMLSFHCVIIILNGNYSGNTPNKLSDSIKNICLSHPPRTRKKKQQGYRTICISIFLQILLTNPVNSAIFQFTNSVNQERMVVLFEKFMNLPEEKKQRILGAAMLVFSQNGYKKTAVDTIVAKAEISKGLIFHYFVSKKNFFLFLYEYCVDLISEEIYSKFDYSERDFFKKLELSQRIKVGVLAQYPYMFDFLKTTYFETDKEVEPGIRAINDKSLNSGFPTIFANTDYSKFKSGVDPQMVMKIIIWSAEGFMGEVNKQGEINIDMICKQFDGYLRLLKENFYKEEALQ